MKSILNARSAIDYSLGNVLFLTVGRLECPSLEPMRRHRHDRCHPRAHHRQTRPRDQSIATGGQAHMIVEGSRYLKIVDEHLTLQGLQRSEEHTSELQSLRHL